ncbi:hypothetical protein FALBO_1838 [Fusarium albosuccineum]|uniref:Uncharacterized protein n=1 Tax=Fusarium albosuccineum TaxID=1237068 RepID=A0A8H4LN52_9HYPO|nr:hypothetical protein FALBO_1838 [Fusarium albosuccineum]KAF4994498.1 hypothetical protein FDECE_13096 [Fusarium decemcellulare]
MRFSKHILPLALVVTGVIAAGDESTTAVAKAKATDEKASATTGEASNTADATEESTATATGKDDDKKDSKSDSKSDSKDKAEATTTEEDRPTDTWKPTVAKTTAPDILSAGSTDSINGQRFVLASLAVGLMTLGMAFL